MASLSVLSLMWIRTVCLGVAGALLMALPVCGEQQQQAVQSESSAQAKPDVVTPLDLQYRKLNELMTFVRKRNAETYKIDTVKGIDEGSYVEIGGIEQWITIRGQDRANPVLLFVHGGPGDVTNPWSYVIFAPWEEQFTVVQWDQRGAGRTLKKSGPSVAETMTVDRMAQDGVEVAEYLKKHLGKQRIIVVCHSFGSILGLRMVRARPDLFYAYVGTGQVADEPRNYVAAYDALLKKARDVRNQRAENELKEVGPPPYTSGKGYQVQRRWSNRFEGADEFLGGTIGLALTAPGGGVEDMNDDGDGQMLSGEKLFSQTRSTTMKDLGLQFAVPVYFFQGTEDFTCPTALAREYMDALKAPRKEFVPIAGGHFAVFMNSDQFLKELVTRARPLAVGQ